MSTGGNVSNAIPGSLQRLGPAHLTGDARTDHTGSTRMFSPDAWISQLAWPTNDNRTLSPQTRAGGLSACGLGAHSGQACRCLPGPNCQRRTSPSDFDGTRFLDPDGSPPKSPGEGLRWHF